MTRWEDDDLDVFGYIAAIVVAAVTVLFLVVLIGV